MKVEIIDWPPTVIVDGKVVYQEEPVDNQRYHDGVPERSRPAYLHQRKQTPND